MITKEVARQIFNCYSEIDNSKKMIEELKKSINEKGEFELKDDWGQTRTIELHLPISMSGFNIKRVPFQLALDVIQIHIQNQQKELRNLKAICKIQLA